LKALSNNYTAKLSKIKVHFNTRTGGTSAARQDTSMTESSRTRFKIVATLAKLGLEFWKLYF